MQKTLLFTVLLLASCSDGTGATDIKPSEVYQAYFQSLADGISIDEEFAVHSSAKASEVREKIDAMQQKSTEEADRFIEFYLSTIHQFAKCTELTLREERIEGKTAYLVFDRQDICDDGGLKESGEKITMVYENGWKIHDSLSAF